MKLNIPVGVSDIEELRKRDYYYVDKTGLIFDLLKNSAAKVTLLTRPRRFGKTLAIVCWKAFWISAGTAESCLMDCRL